MRLEIPLSEVQQFLSEQYRIKIDLKNIDDNKIEAKYIDSVVLIIKEVKENTVLFYYEVDGLATIVTKIAHLFLDKKLDKTPIDWDSKNKEIKIDLNKFSELKTFFEYVSISELHFIKETIVLEMYPRSKA